jgi:hypothetical protein
MQSIDHLLNRVSTPEYNCWNFAVEAWLYLTGEDLRERMPGLQGRFTQRRISLKGARMFSRLEAPTSPCIALMERPRQEPHIGVFYLGRILHLPTNQMPEYQTPRIAMRAFKTIRWYK